MKLKGKNNFFLKKKKKLEIELVGIWQLKMNKQGMKKGI